MASVETLHVGEPQALFKKSTSIHPNPGGMLRINELTAGLNPLDPNEKEVIDALHTFDADKDGTISVTELIKVGERRVYNEKKIKGLKKLVLGISFVSVIFCGVMLGLMIAANEASKDDKPDDDGTLKTIDGKYVSTTTTQSKVSMKDLASVDPKELINMESALVQVVGGSWRLYTVTGYNWFSDTHIQLFTARGDIIRIQNQEITVISPNGERMEVISRRKLLADSDDMVTVNSGGIKLNTAPTGTNECVVSTTCTQGDICVGGMCVAPSAKVKTMDSDSDKDSDSS